MTTHIANTSKDEESQKTILNKAIQASVNGDIYSLKKIIRTGFDLKEKEHICITEAAILGETHIVSYIIEKDRPPENILKKLTNMCADNFKNETLVEIVKKTGIYSNKAKDVAQYSGNTFAVDYITDRELYEDIGRFYKTYKALPQRIDKLICSNKKKYKDGEPEPLGFSNTNPEVIRTLKGIVYKPELPVMLEICCREGLKDAAQLLYHATQLKIKQEFAQNNNVPAITEGSKNSPLDYAVSFGSNKDYLKLKKEGAYLGLPFQTHNLGATICLGIKNKNYDIVEDLINSGYCPMPPNSNDHNVTTEKLLQSDAQKSSARLLNQIENAQMFNSVINDLLQSDDQKSSARLLNAILKNFPHDKDKEIQGEIKIQEYPLNFALKAIKTGREELAKIFLRNIDLKTLINKLQPNNTSTPSPPYYVLRWIIKYQVSRMIADEVIKSPDLSIN